jgi:hypothetical protein
VDHLPLKKPFKPTGSCEVVSKETGEVMSEPQNIDPQIQLEAEAAAFRKLVAHLQERTDVQNIDLMNLSGFCRNCLSKWLQAALTEKGVDIDKMEARELVYGMPYDEWKDKHQL